MSRRRVLVGTILALIWMFVVTAAYYIAHKPFTISSLALLRQVGGGLVQTIGSASLAAFGRAASSLAGAGLVLTLGVGIGVLLLRRLDLAPVERLAWGAPLGLGVISLAALALGMLGQLRPWVLWLLTGIVLLVTARSLWWALRTAWADTSWRPQSRFEKWLAIYCGLTLAAALTWALLPPTAWDGLVYHLTGPKLYLATGRISHPLDLPYLGFPQLVEMLFTWAIGLAGERAAAPVHWGYALFAVLALVTAGRRWLGGAAGWLAAAVLLSASTIVALTGWPYVDLALLLYATLAFLALVRFCEANSRTWLILSGVLVGLALSTKYTALALLPALAVALFSRLQITDSKPQMADLRLAIRHSQSALLNLLLLFLTALITWYPWLLKNLLLTGNPMYPFFFGGIYWDDWRSWWYDRPGTGLASTAPWKLLTAPWDATIWGMEGAAGYGATIGPFFLALLPFLFLVWRQLPHGQRRWLSTAAAFCGVVYIYWLWGIARSGLLLQSRLLFPAFGLLALMVGAAVEGLKALPSPPIDLGWLTRAVVLVVLALALLGTLVSTAQVRPLGVLLGSESQDEYLSRQLGWYHLALDAVNRLPAGATVVFLWEPRSFHCSADCWPDALLDRFFLAVQRHGPDADLIAAHWRSEGATHVLLNQVGWAFVLEESFDPVTEADVAALEALQRDHMEEMESFGEVYTLYRLRRP